MNMEFKSKFVINAFFYGMIALAAVAVYKYILPILTPFIIGFIVAWLVQLPLKKLSKKYPKWRRPLAVLLGIAFYLAVGGLLILLGVKLYSQIAELVLSLPGLFENTLLPLFVALGDQLERKLAPIDPMLVSYILDAGEAVISQLGQILTDFSAWAVKAVANGAVGVPGLIIQIILTVVSTFYIAGDYEKITGFLKKLIPEKQRPVTVRTIGYARTAVVAYIKSYGVIFVVTFLELSIGLSILGIPYAAVLGLCIAVFDLMPVLGTGGVLLPWALTLALMGNFPLAIGILVLYVIITAVRNTLEPRIVGEQIGLHPMATLVAMILGLKLVGLPGMLFFPITLVALTHLKRSEAEKAK